MKREDLNSKEQQTKLLLRLKRPIPLYVNRTHPAKLFSNQTKEQTKQKPDSQFMSNTEGLDVQVYFK
jgi:hypothetical protein